MQVRSGASTGEWSCNGTVRVLFAEGLFSAGTEFAPDQQDALVALGKRLPGLDTAITVTAFAMQSGDQGRPPSRNAAQNRTVILTLTAR